MYGILDRVGSTCTTPHISLLFEATYTLLAGCAKWMVVRVPLLVDLTEFSSWASQCYFTFLADFAKLMVVRVLHL